MSTSFKESKKELKNFFEFFSTLFVLRSDIVKLFFLEYKLARISLKLIIIYAIIFLMLAFTLWVAFSLVCIWLLHILTSEWLISVSIVIGMNLLLMALIVWRIKSHTKNFYFSYTRKNLFKSKQKESSFHDDSATKEADSATG